MTEETYASEKALAKRWSLSPKTLQRWRWLNTGPNYVKIGGRIRYSSTAIKEYEEKNIHIPKNNESSMKEVSYA